MDLDEEWIALQRAWNSCEIFGSVYPKEPPPRDDPSWKDVGPPTALCTCEYPCDSIFAVPGVTVAPLTGKISRKPSERLRIPQITAANSASTFTRNLILKIEAGLAVWTC
jgi:hypothetical protein